MGYVEDFRKNFKNNDFDKCVEILFHLHSEYKNNFRKVVLRKDLFTTPISYKYTTEFHKKVSKIILLAFEKNTDDNFSSQIFQIAMALEAVHENYTYIMESIEASNFFNYTFLDIVSRLLSFTEEQIDKSSNKNNTETNVNILGELIAKNETSLNPNVKISILDNQEALIEMLNGILPLFYHVEKNKNESNNVNPTSLKIDDGVLISFIIMINQKYLIMSYWDRFKYDDRLIQIQKTKNDNKEIYTLIPTDIYKEKIYSISKFRNTSYVNETLKRYSIKYQNEINYGHLIITKLSTMVNVNNQSSFYNIENEDYSKALLFYKYMKKCFEDIIPAFYLKQKVCEIPIIDILSGHEFLVILSMIYSPINDKNSSNYYIVPIIEIDFLMHLFCKFYNFSAKISKKIINFYVFRNQRDSGLDIFSQPLIYAGNDKIYLSSKLIGNMNLFRFVENLCNNNKVKISENGKVFEVEFRNKLAQLKMIEVNTNKLSFHTSGDEDTEYDCLATFDDYLIVMEFRTLILPYDNKKRLRENEKKIKFGVKQVNKRCDIIKTDWDKIKSMVNIKLPDKPYTDDKIIRIFCTNVYDFSSLVYDGVIVTDKSLLFRFFSNPYKIQSKTKERLWQKERPTVCEFLNYLKKPDIISIIIDSLEPRAIPFYNIVPDKEIPLLGYLEYQITKEGHLEKYLENYSEFK